MPKSLKHANNSVSLNLEKDQNKKYLEDNFALGTLFD